MNGSRDRRPIVVGVDASDSAREATGWAADLASAQGSPLRLVHVVPGGYEDAPIAPVPAWLAELSAVALRLGVDRCHAEVQPGGRVGVLASRAEGAAMLVLGSYGEAAWSGMLAGSVALTLLERVRCPVAVIRGRAPRVPPPRGGPVVVGVEASPVGRSALDVGAGLAAALGARLVGTRAWSDVVPGGDGSAHRRPEEWDALAAEARDLLAVELGRAVAAHPELVVEPDPNQATPLRALLDRAAAARMIVVGHRRAVPPTTGRPGVLLGSTSRGLVEFAQCPVVVVGPAVVAAQPMRPVPGS